MSDKLPDKIDPLLLAERRSVFSGVIKIATLERLSELVLASDEEIKIDVVFAKEAKQAIVTGNIKANLSLECQFCLQALIWPIDINFKLGIVSSILEADTLELDCEPLIFVGDKISFNALIEDEILLALPDYPKHDYDCIKNKRNSENSAYDAPNNRPKAENPFSVLAKLKNTGE